MPFPASDSEMGILRHKNNKPAKAKRAAKKPAASRSSKASRKASGKAKDSSAKKAVKSRTRPSPRKHKNSAEQIEPPKPNLDSDQEGAPPPLSITVPASPRAASTVTDERRRWPERSGPAASSRGDSGEPSETPPRPNKLVPTNAVHPTERRIKRRMHKNGALLAAAGAALLGVLILSNQSEPPEQMLSDRQIASRLPAAQDWQNDATTDSVPKTAARAPALPPARIHIPDSDSPRVTAPAPPERQLAARPQLATRSGELSRGNIVEIERILSRLDLAASAPDGIVDDDTTQAIRLYQEIAGLPVDGKASQNLLTDMREVVKILDSDN